MQFKIMNANITVGNASSIAGSLFDDFTAILTAAVLGLLILATVVGEFFFNISNFISFY